MSDLYTPAPYPSNSDGVGLYVYQELQRLSTILSQVSDNILEERHTAPNKPQNGQLVYADGTNWNPGSGRGVYYYKGNTWVFIA